MSPESDKSPVSPGDSISVVGFVKAPGRYSYRAGMTAEDALEVAGGYDTCRSCQAYWEETRHHPTYDSPPKVKRAGRRHELPKLRAEWSRFKLEPDDEIEFRHFDF